MEGTTINGCHNIKRLQFSCNGLFAGGLISVQSVEAHLLNAMIIFRKLVVLFVFFFNITAVY